MISATRYLFVMICMVILGCQPAAPKRDGDWLQTHQEEVRRDCQPVLDALNQYYSEHRRYPKDEGDPSFAVHANWLDAQNWNWTYYTEPDGSAFCLGIGDYDMDGISVVWCSAYGGWALDTKDRGLVKLDPQPTTP